MISGSESQSRFEIGGEKPHETGAGLYEDHSDEEHIERKLFWLPRSK